MLLTWSEDESDPQQAISADARRRLETCTDARLPWASTPAKHSYAGFPAMEEYQPLVEAFAAEA